MQNANTFPLRFDCCIDMQIDCQIVVIVAVIVLVVVVAVFITVAVVVAAAATVSPSPLISAGGSPESGSRRCDLGWRRRRRHPKTPAEAAQQSRSHSKYSRKETEVNIDLVRIFGELQLLYTAFSVIVLGNPSSI